MRKWRLLRARELQIETYKIFQNRTLSEMIRRRRNDPKWARADNATKEASAENNPAGSHSETGSGQDEDNKFTLTLPAYDKVIAGTLAECWGVGPAKVKEGGYAWEALAVLNRPSIDQLLEQSRQLATATSE